MKFFAFFLSLAFCAQVSAEPAGFGIRPLHVEEGRRPTRWSKGYFEARLPVGGTFSDVVEVMSLSPEPIQVTLEAADGTNTETGNLIGVPKPSADGVATGLKLEQTTLLLQPNEKKRVRFTLQVPPGARAGEHLCYIFAKMHADNQAAPAAPVQRRDTQAAMRVDYRLGQLLLVRVGTEDQEQAGVEIANAGKRVVDGQLQLESVVRNSGNVLLKPKIEAELLSAGGTRVVFKGLAAAGYLVPGGSLQYRLEIPKNTALPRGDYRLNLKVDYGQAVKESSTTLALP